MENQYHLVVVHDFDLYKRGDKVTDDVEVSAILAGEKSHHVHKVLKDFPATAPTVKKSK